MAFLDVLAAIVPSRRLARRLADKAERARWRRQREHAADFRACCAALSGRVSEACFVKVGGDAVENVDAGRPPRPPDEAEK